MKIVVRKDDGKSVLLCSKVYSSLKHVTAAFVHFLELLEADEAWEMGVNYDPSWVGSTPRKIKKKITNKAKVEQHKAKNERHKAKIENNVASRRRNTRQTGLRQSTQSKRKQTTYQKMR